MSPTAKIRSGGVWVQSGKTGKARLSGADVYYAPPSSGGTPISLFTTQTPAGFFEDGIQMSLGVIMSFSVPGTITHVKWYCPPNPPGGVVYAAVFGMNEARLTGDPDVTFGTLTPAAWNSVALTTPLAIPTPGERVIGIKTPSRYPASTNSTTPVSPFPLTNGPLSVLSGGGRFTTFGNASNRVEFPGSGVNNGCYFVDVIFVPD